MNVVAVPPDAGAVQVDVVAGGAVTLTVKVPERVVPGGPVAVKVNG